MPGWKEAERKVGFEDMPEHLRHVDADSPEELVKAQAEWLEEHGLALVDYFSWLRSRRPGNGATVAAEADDACGTPRVR